MVEVAQTRELFSALISKPQLEDRLLQRPPFKFIHDIVNETIHATGFLSNLYTSDELNSQKAGLNRDTKIAFVKKLVDALNADGDLDDVSPAKIVAGKEADRTNQLLQKLAVQAAANNFDRPTKQSRDKKRHRSSSTKAVEQKQETPVSRERQREEKKKEVEREKRRLSRALKNIEVPTSNGIDSAPTKIKKRSKKSEEKVRDKSKEKSKEKSTKKKSGDEKVKEKSKKRHSEKEIDEGIGSATPHLAQRREIGGSPIPRESSGGTSKAEDSGIAEPTTSSGNELHDSERQSSATLRNYPATTNNQGTPDRLLNEAEKLASSRNSNLASPANLIDDGDSSRQRPLTAVGRPQTTIGRPGTAAARPAPPRIKKTKIGDIDPTTIAPQPATFEKSAVIVEDTHLSSAKSNQGNAENDFILDEEEDTNGTINGLDTQVAAELDAGEEHGALVNRIIANARDIQKESSHQDGDEFEVMDAVEARKLRADVDSCRNSLQSVAQTVQPLSRTLEFVAEDFDVLLREIEESRKRRSHAQRQLAEKARKDDGSAALVAQLRNMDAELIQVRSQIAKTTASMIENEKRINELMALN